MTTDDDSNINFEIDLELSDRLKSEGVIQRFVKNIRHNYIKIELNHKYEKSNVIVSTANIKDWSKFHESLKKMLNLKGLYDQEHIRLILNAVDDNHELVIENNNNGINQYSSITLQQEQEEEQKEKRQAKYYCF